MDAIQKLISDLEASKVSSFQQPVVVPIDDFVAALNEIEGGIGPGSVNSVNNTDTYLTVSPTTGAVVVNVDLPNLVTALTADFDVAGSAATAQANAEAFTTSQINGSMPGTISPPSVSLPTSKIIKGDGSAHGQAVFDAASILGVIDGGGSPITAGSVLYVSAGYAGQITSVTLLADESGSLTLNVWKCTYAQFDAGVTHPVSGDSITASDTPALSSASKYTDSTLTGWTTTFATSDVFAFQVPALATNVKRLTVILGVNKT